MYRWPSAKVTAGGSSGIGNSPIFANVRSDGVNSALADTVRKPPVKKRLIAWTALGEAQVALPLERLERSQKHRFAAGRTARREEGVERGQRCRPDPPVRRQVGIVLAVAVERRQGALQEGHGHRRAHV